MINIFLTIINLNLIGSIIAIIAIIFRFVFKNKLPKAFLICLWCIVFIKFVLPISFPSPTSIFNSIKPEIATQIIQDTVIYTNAENNASPLVIKAPPVIETPVEEVTNTTQSAIPTKIFLSNILGIIWLCGMLIMLFGLILIYILTIKRFKTSHIVQNNDQINSWIKNIKIKRNIKVYTSINVSTPLVFGVLRPKIIFPNNFDFTKESALNHILAHELQHIKQFDNLTNIFVLMVLCIHWFNPIMWICYLLFQRDIETFCDERVLCSIGEECKSEYATSLLDIARNRQKLSPAFIFSFGETSVKERVKSIMKHRKITVLSVVVAIILLSSVVIIFATGGMKNTENVYKGETKITNNDTLVSTNDIKKIDIMSPDEWNTIEYLPGRNEESTTKIGALEYTTKDNKKYDVTNHEDITGEITDKNVARFENLSIVPVSEGKTTLEISYQGLSIEENITINKAVPKKLLLNGSENKVYVANNDTINLGVSMVSESGKEYELKPEDYTLNIDNTEIITDSINSSNGKKQLIVKKPGETEASVSYQGLNQKYTIISTDDNNFVIRFGDKILQDGSSIDYNRPGLFNADGTPYDSTGTSVDIECIIQQQDGQNLNITSLCTWKVSDETVFTIDAISRAIGNDRGNYIKPGTCTITAEYKGKIVSFTIKN